jgi:glycosyltransferase involved in cell wall biosynthesis
MRNNNIIEQQENLYANAKIAVTIPCYNEAVTIEKVVRDFTAILPQATIHVFDNNSEDGSADLARKAGACVHHVRKRGKGHVMQAIFDSIDTDILVVVDGDDTYYAEDALRLIEPILKGEADMVVGNRLKSATDESMSRLHQFGNRLILKAVNFMFKTNYKDILSGYRAISRRFVKNVPLLTSGFEIETELTLQALEREIEITEIPISYRNRPEGSESKLKSFHDGSRIIMTAAIILRDHKPIRLFGLISLLCFLFAGISTALRILNYFGITSLPNEVLTGTVLIFSPLGIVSLAIGLILCAVNTRFRELNQLIDRNKWSGP